jgi:hypothetical protein
MKPMENPERAIWVFGSKWSDTLVKDDVALVKSDVDSVKETAGYNSNRTGG